MEARGLIEQCRKEVTNAVAGYDKKDYLRDKLRGFEKKKTAGEGFFHIDYKVGHPTAKYYMQCCKFAFGLCYGIGKTYLDKLIQEIKVSSNVGYFNSCSNNLLQGGVVATASPLNDKTSYTHDTELHKEMIKYAKRRKFNLTTSHLAMVKIHNSAPVNVYNKST